jgi:hypothetical protein
MKFAIFALFCLALNAVSAGFTEGTCWKKAHGRGIGKPMLGGSVSCGKGYVMEAGTCYTKCPKQAKGGSAMKGIGILCWDYSVVPAKTATRKIGKSTCKAPLVSNQSLCYAKCPGKMVGIGPVCWSNCKGIKANFDSCGAMCTEKTKCSKNTMAAISTVFNGIMSIAKTATGDLDKMDKVSGAFDEVKKAHKEFSSINVCKQ